MKAEARVSIIKQLSKENLETVGIDLESLSDTELKHLNRKFHNYLSELRYAVRIGGDFKEDLVNGNLAFYSFRNTPGIRFLTFTEFIQFERFDKENPNVYRHYRYSEKFGLPGV